MSACARSAHHFGRRLLRSSTASSCSLCSTHLLFVPQETSLSSSSSSSTLSSSSLTLKRSSSIMAPIQNMTRSPVAHTRSATAPALSTSLITSPASSAEPTLSSSGSRSTVTQPSFATTAESVVSGSILIPESPASLVHHPANITSSAPLSFHNNRCAEGAKFQTQTAVATFDRYFDSSKCSNDTSKSIDSNSVTQPIDSNESDSSPSSAQTQQHPNLNLKRIYRNNLYNRSSRNDTEMRAPPFKPQKALILTKFSRLEYEQRRMPDCSEDQVKDSLVRRGSDYEGLLAHHKIHTRSRDHVRQVLEEAGIKVRVVNRFQYNDEQIDWADVIITAGGDGTFLMAASKIYSKNKPVIGINSDPSRSVGYLCLDPEYSMDFGSALLRLYAGNFRWVYRQRIRVSIKGESSMDPPAELHNQQLLHPEFRYLDLETHPLNRRSNSPPRPDAALSTESIDFNDYHVLPVRALNDVFVGECLSSRVSYFEFAVDDRPSVKVKSSGVTICTGTGSTSWSFNINKISPQSVQTLFSLIKEETGISLDANNQQLVRKLTKRFNDSLIFDVCEQTMAYTVRDPVYMGNEFDSENRGFTRKVSIKSRMFDACVVIDGGLSYAFNDGSYARFELLDEDQLQTIAFD